MVRNSTELCVNKGDNAKDTALHPLQIQTDPRVLSTVLSFRDSHQHAWSTKDLSEMLRHQLGAPLRVSLGVLSGEAADRLRDASPPAKADMTLGELLAHRHPPLELLKLVKRFAKICREDPDHPLPPEIVNVMYYASITAALVRLGKKISSLELEAFGGGLHWLVQQPWMTDEMRSLFLEGRTSLNTNPAPREGATE